MSTVTMGEQVECLCVLRFWLSALRLSFVLRAPASTKEFALGLGDANLALNTGLSTPQKKHSQKTKMVPVLRALGVHAACVGNHDLDMSVEQFEKLKNACGFPWLLANVLDVNTREPLGGAARTALLDAPGGVKVGVVGLAEQEWVETLPMIEPEELEYLDFVTEGRRLASELRAAGADVVVALT